MMIRFVLACLCATLASCLSASAPLEIQWYSLEAFREPPRVIAPDESLAPLSLRSLDVRASGSVDERFSTLLDGGRVRYAEDLRWVEGPQPVLERRMRERLLRDERVALGSPRAELAAAIDLQEFGERVSASRRDARIVLEVVLRKNDRAVDSRRYEVSTVLEAPGTAQLVETLSLELDALLGAILDDLVETGSRLDGAEADSAGTAGTD